MDIVLLILVIALAILVFAQILKLGNISQKLRGSTDSGITDKDNKQQGFLFLLFGIIFMTSFIYMYLRWNGVILSTPASEHGVDTDFLLSITWLLLIIVFFTVQPALFYFAYKYSGSKNRKAKFYSHNNKLELIWTAIPALTLAILVTYGLMTWNKIMYLDQEDEPIVVELYAQQFNWTARYAGSDNQLGHASVRMITAENPLGLDANDKWSKDDKVVKEIYLPVGKKVLFKIRSQDVMHSAYMPHFRAQMNCVPGMVTQFAYTPTITTKDFRKQDHIIRKVNRINKIREERRNNGEDADPYEFNYLLLCNKICGSAHYNMQMDIVVVEEEEYNTWLSEQQSFVSK